MNKRLTVACLFLGVIVSVQLVLSGCGAVNPYYDRNFTNWQESVPPDSSKILHTVYLIGDAGSPSKNEQEPSLKLLESFLRNSGSLDSSGYGNENDVVVFLGDNIYQHGLPPIGDGDREDAEFKITEQLKVVAGFKGKKYFVPGNHDWKASNKGGLEQVNRQERFVEDYLGQIDAWLPSNGCPGAVDVQISEDLVIFFIDTEWWLHRWEKPYAPENGCLVASELDFMVRLDDLLNKYKGKNILITQHHPIASNGNHGGHYSLKDHIFPLTLVREKLYIPFPIIGSIYPLGRMYGTSRQDIAHPLYLKLIDGMLSAIDDQENVILAAGHEHNLQHWRLEEGLTQIVSGSGCKDKYAIKGNDATFVHDHKGFALVKYYDNGEAWVEYWEPVDDGSKGELVFRIPAYSRKIENLDNTREILSDEDYRDSTIVMAAGEEYASFGIRNIFLGEHYRKSWEAKTEIPYLDIRTYAGGLKPLQKGGGKQTISLRMVNPDGVQYTLRSVNKNPSRALPVELQRTFAEDILQDQISSAHPYGALTIPVMAEQLGILHARPELVYVPYTPLLGPYLPDFGGMMATIEVRPQDDMGCLRGLGCLDKVVSTRTMFRRTLDDNDDEIDTRMFLKARLFDMLIGDWDRHEDQWRWAEKPKEDEDKGSIFLPIPRDRDQVYVKLDGLLPRIGSAKWAVRHLSNFTDKYNDIVGINISATSLDRTYLNELTRAQWHEMADTIQRFLTDSIIEEAIRQMPPEAFEVSGEEIIRKLKSRRDLMNEAADEYYEVLAERVDVIGSNKHEFVLVERLSDDSTRVRVYKKKKEGRIIKEIYDRTFYRSETKEVNIFTKAGRDSVILRGDVRRGILVRVIPGQGLDYVLDSSNVRGFANKTIVIENHDSNQVIIEGPSTDTDITSDPDMIEYDRSEFRYDYLGPRLYIEYNEDDGMYLGLGVLNQLHGFKRNPYKLSHYLRANYAVATGAYNFRYEGTFYSLFRKNFDLEYNFRLLGPSYQMNYFGEGDETVLEHPVEYYRLRMNLFRSEVFVNRRFTEFFTIGAGPLYEQFNLEETPGRFFVSDNFPHAADLEDVDRYVGGKLKLDIDFRDNLDQPTRGVLIKHRTEVRGELGGGDLFSRISGSLNFYFSPSFPNRVTLATRAGGAFNIGNYKFYQGNFLGGFTNLRGYYRTRFAGRAVGYHNTDLRWRLFNFRNYVFTGTGGLIGFFDYGKVWADEDISDNILTGYGPGMWINFYDYFVVSGYYGFSKEGEYLTVKFGFFF